MAAASEAHEASPDAHTTEEQTVREGPLLDPAKPGFFQLVAGPGSPYVVRRIAPAGVTSARGDRRRSLAYFGQLTDFQLADEESPARVEFVDRGPSSAWRPQEAFHPFAIDYSLRQMNNFAGASPVTQAGGARARMGLALLTGDNSDNQQTNETLWVRQLLEGERVDPNSGRRVNDYAECGPVGQAALLAKGVPPEPTYVGVQDYSDYFPAHDFYDPNQPSGPMWANWPRYQGLMDRAQVAFDPAGLAVPSYIANGNHDGLVQGNEDANQEYERIATGCVKLVTTTSNFPFGPPTSPNPSFLLGPGTSFFVPPDDPGRRFVDKVELKKIYSSGSQADDHGFAFVDPAEYAASGGSASYYAWDPVPGIRFVSIDTLSEGGVVEESSNGNIDDPQWKWLERELDQASKAGKLVVVFGHHPVRSLTADPPDEAAPPCTGQYDAQGNYSGTKDAHGHDPNPGCDLDRRPSTPVHLGQDLVGLFHGHPNVIAYVAGHTHENKIIPFEREGGGWWEINTSAVADWPQQNRLIEVMDNRDGTLSIFGTVLDHSSPHAIPSPTADTGTVAGFSVPDLAALGRSFSYNDPQSDRARPPNDPTGADGMPEDRNVELLLLDPRKATAAPGVAGASGRRPKIRLAVKPQRPKRGKRTRFRFVAKVKINGRKLALVRARIKLGGKRVKTDSRGRATMVRKFRKRGRYKARASFKGYRSATKRVRVSRR
jgi:hypothetical protein